MDIKEGREAVIKTLDLMQSVEGHRHAGALMHYNEFIKSPEHRKEFESIVTEKLGTLVAEAEKLETDKQQIMTIPDKEAKESWEGGVALFSAGVVLVGSLAIVQNGNPIALVVACFAALFAFRCLGSFLCMFTPVVNEDKNAAYTLNRQHEIAKRMWVHATDVAAFMQREKIQVQPELLDKIYNKAKQALDEKKE